MTLRLYAALLTLFTAVIAVAAATPQNPADKPDAEAAEFFEAKVRPVLVANCFGCHGEKQQAGNLRLDSLQAMLKGNSGGAVVVPGKPEKSPLVEVINYGGKVRMPPTGKLKPEEIAAITEWVKRGAVWPGVAVSDAAKAAAKSGEFVITGDMRKFWSFQPVRKPRVPAVKNRKWVANPVDSFVLARLEARGLKPSAAASRRDLIRRAYFDLIGLPPTAEQVDAFVADKSPDAFAKVVDRLLGMPQYGERWGRHWLDVARYADTRGYNFVDGRIYENAYTFRDYVIRAFNEDLPYDRFVVEQIAADHLVGLSGASGSGGATVLQDDRRPLAAMGFLTVGRRFLNNMHDIIDDRIDVVTRGFMGLTVNCARCHDHKFDPIPTKDYYALYGVFASSIEPNPPPSISPKEVREPWEQFNNRVKDLDSQINALIQNEIRALRGRLKDNPGSFTAIVKNTLQAIRIGAKPTPDQLSKIEKDFLPAGADELKKLRAQLAQVNSEKPKVPVEFAMTMVDAPNLVEPAVLIRGNPSNRGAKVPRQFLEILCAPEGGSNAQGRGSNDVSGPRTAGFSPANSRLSPPDSRLPIREPFKRGSGRLELAQAIASPQNPLTARVFVNRVWRHHFGQGIVRSPSDFGTRGEKPTHPELLDWLAATFVENGWSVKKLHRQIMLSSTYQQSCDIDPKAALADPENRLFSHQNRRRLDLEQMRDSILWVAGTLDMKIGGPSVEIAGRDYKPRRTVYGFIDRQNLPGLFRTFDLASPDSSSPQRFTTTVPQQALFMMNSPFIEDQTKALAKRKEFEAAKTDEERVRAAYRIVFGRAPSPIELSAGVDYLKAPPLRVALASAQGKVPAVSNWERYLQALLMTNEFCFVD